MTTQHIQLRRGTAADLPDAGIEGEPRFTTDTGLLYVDDGTNNVLIGGTNNTYETNALITYGSGSVYTDATVTTALTSLGTTNKATLLLSPGTWVFDENIDYSTYTNITFKLPPGAIISHSTYTVNIPNIEAGLYQIFTGTGAVTISGSVKEAYPQWWGAVGDDSTDNTTALQAFITCLEASDGFYGRIPKGIYQHKGLTITKPIKLTGDGAYDNNVAGTLSGTVLKNIHATNDSLAITAAVYMFGLSIEDIAFLGVRTNSGDGIVVNGEGTMLLTRLIVMSHGGDGIKLATAAHTDGLTIQQCLVYYNVGNGIYGRSSSAKQINAINIFNNYIQGNSLTTGGGINLFGNSINIKHNVIQSNKGAGVMLSGEDQGNNSYSVTNNNIDGNYFEANAGGEILAECSYSLADGRIHTIQNVTIRGNSFHLTAAQANVGVTGLITFQYNDSYTECLGFANSQVLENRYNTDTLYWVVTNGTLGQYSTLQVDLPDGIALSDRYNVIVSQDTILEYRSRYGAGYPTITPDYRGQKYFDTTNERHWLACGSGNIAYWKPITRQPQVSVTDYADTAPTVTIAAIFTGLVTGTPTAGRAYTLSTGTLADASLFFGINDYFDWTVINLAAATHAITVTAGDTHTVVGNMVVSAATSGRFRTRKTAANTFITYRIG